MPLINVCTSIKEPRDTEELLRELSREISALTGKPEQFVMAILQHSVPMAFAGNTDPCCYVEVKSIGSINQQNISKSICRLIEERLGISGKRTYIGFEDVHPSNWGFDGRTFG